MTSPYVRPRRSLSADKKKDPFASPSVYYGDDDPIRRLLLGGGNRAVTSYLQAQNETISDRTWERSIPARRSSHDEHDFEQEEYLLNVKDALERLLKQEDLDGDGKITIEDKGPKEFFLGTASSAGHKTRAVRGNYRLSVLLQELYLAQDLGRTVIKIHQSRLSEDPVSRLSRRIKDEYWKNLTRVLDARVIEKAGTDPKDWTDNPRPRIYVPRGCPEQHEYYTQVANDRPEINLDVQWLPEGGVTPEYVRSLNNKPGILALAMRTVEVDGKETLRGEPFVVPGGRFNELYGWDSYMMAIGLLENKKIDLAMSMVKNFIFCIQHYGKILNANRSYYLCRSQPPFLTDMALKIYDSMKHQGLEAEEFLKQATLAAIKEYYSVWMAKPRYDADSHLSRYRPEGLGVPPETEASHFVHIITPFAKKHGLTFDQFVKAYNADEIKEPELDEYFLHDRAVRESGHDTSYRLEGVAANLATVDLNSCLYKYEMDIAMIIRDHFNNNLAIPPEFQTEENRIDAQELSQKWDRRAKLRQRWMTKLMWDEKEGMFFDYDTAKKQRTNYESVTTFWTMWAGLAKPTQAAAMVVKALPKFEEYGGLASGTESSRGEIHLERPNRQWDYPYGWAPQQMLAWGGLHKYGYTDEVRRLVYKWLYMVTQAFNDFNGVVVEKYNVTRQIDPHKVDAEYGNQGADFKGVPREGFGWVNSSYVYGLRFIDVHMRRALNNLTPWATFERMTQMKLEDGTILEGSDESGTPSSGAATPALIKEVIVEEVVQIA
jgi:alpha,alpha-trehalase